MGHPSGFIDVARLKARYRPVAERVRDWQEIELPLAPDALRSQASRCMDCGVPFCHQGCPLGNVIPEWNDLVYRGRWQEASEALHATNNFPEFTGRVCPAPCEASCVLALTDAPVTIREVERQIVDRGFDEGWITPQLPATRTGRRVAVVGSGPAGLAAAQELVRAGHEVTVFERDAEPGGLLRWGIPDFKLEKWRVARRIAQLAAEGVTFRCNVRVGDDVSARSLRDDFDAVVLAVGARRARDLDAPGRALRGVELAMDYLSRANARVPDAETVAGCDVLILGGGDTGADCLGTAHREGARSVTQWELLPRPPGERGAENPWPHWPMVYRTSPAHEEGGARDFGVMTVGLVDDGHGAVAGVRAVRVTRGEHGALVPVEGSEFTVPAQRVLLAMGFMGVEPAPWLDVLGVKLTARGTVAVGADGVSTDAPGVFACGDAQRGASLVVWAIREGRDAARATDAWLRRAG
jgi:glutamate synthase (NADPH/NADH) small chain